jgi:DNA-directed RNA polymerase beta' subunit
MRIRIGPQLSFASTCAPIEALRGDYDGDEINLHLPQGSHVTAELRTILSVSEQIVTGQSGSPVVKLIQDSVVSGDLSYVLGEIFFLL